MESEIEALKAKVEDLEERLEKIEDKFEEEGSKIREKPTSLPEFKQKCSPSDYQERATMIGYFLEYEKGKENFSSKDIKEGYKKCDYESPANMSDVLSNAQGKGWITEVGKEGPSKLWVLTRTGEKFVEEELKNE